MTEVEGFLAWAGTKNVQLMQYREGTEVVYDPCSYYRCQEGFVTNSYNERVECPDCRGKGYAREREIAVTGWVEADKGALLAEFLSIRHQRERL